MIHSYAISLLHVHKLKYCQRTIYTHTSGLILLCTVHGSCLFEVDYFWMKFGEIRVVKLVNDTWLGTPLCDLMGCAAEKDCRSCQMGSGLLAVVMEQTRGCDLRSAPLGTAVPVGEMRCVLTYGVCVAS